MPVGDHGDDVVTWKVRVASRASKSGDHEIVETEVGDLVVEIGPWARVGDLVIELAGSHGLCDDPADIGWAGLELADGSMAAADERLCTLPVAHGDRLVVVVGIGDGDAPAPAAAFGAAGAPSVRYGLMPVDEHGGGPLVELDVGLVPIGRNETDNIVVLDDPSVSRRHARLLVGNEVVVTDVGSTNGTAIDGVPVSGDRRLPVGSRLELGDVSFELRAIAPIVVDPSLDDSRPPSGRPTPERGTVAFNREPTVPEPIDEVTITLPEPPTAPEEHRMPWLSIAIPLALAAAMVAVPLIVGGLDRSYIMLSAGFLLMSPIMVLASFWETRRVAARRRRVGLADFRERVESAERRGRAAVDDERRRREVAYPGPTARRRQSRLAETGLWAGAERFDEQVRIGVGRIPTLVRFRRDGGGALWPENQPPLGLDGEACAELERVAASVRHHDAAPVAVPASGLAAVVGERDWADAVVRAIVLQLATALPPTAVRFTIATDEPDAFDWAKWLPHDIGTGTVVAQSDAGIRHVVVVDAVDGSRLLERAELAADAARSGAFVVWAGRRRADIPTTTTTLIEAVGPGGLVGGPPVADVVDLPSGGVVRSVSVDLVGGSEADRWARDLAPLRNPVGGGDPGRLPAAVPIGDVLVDRAALFDPDIVVEAWAQPGPLSARLGRTTAGIATVDLRRDGPHAVIAGTTGAGKSELLQTMVVSLAMSRPPSQVNFLLVDYKGGAAFAECAALPHTVGLVTDLDGTLVRRVLTSLRAEIRRRESILAAAGAKDLVTLEERDPAGAPPSLVIVVDEFASLTTEVPGFVEDMIDLARRGRSLGLHLVLATQRPAGVVSDHLLANANLRIALRVADVHESTDLVGVPDAAAIARTRPGRAVARLGPGDVLHLQTAFCGGRTPVPDGRDRSRDVVVHDFGIEPMGDGAAPVVSVPDDAPTDLCRLVEIATAAAGRSGEPAPRRPWLEPLPARVEMSARLAGGPDGRVTAVVGVADDPDRQSQFVMRYDLGAGSLAVYGAGDAPARFVSAVVAGLVRDRSPADLQIDVIDGETGALRQLESLPHVGSVVDAADSDRISRLLRQLSTSIARRGERGPTRLIVVNDLAGFAGRSERLDGGAAIEALARIATDGPPAGVLVITLAGRRVGVPPVLAASTGRRVVMAMTTDDDAVSLGVDPSLLAVDAPGRAVVDGLAVQTIDLPVSGDWSIEAIAARAVARWGELRAPSVGVLPERIEASAVGASSCRDRPSWGSVLIGLDDRDLRPVEADLADGNLLIAGPLRSGRSTALGSIAASLLTAGRPGRVRPILIAPRSTDWARSPIWSGVGIGEHALPVLRRAGESVGASDGASTVIFVDDTTDLDDEVDEELARLAALTRHTELRIVAAAESVLARRAYGGLVAELRRERRALLLQPDVDLDGDLAGVRLARRSLRPVPPGRGEWVERGVASLVQVAVASHALPTGDTPWGTAPMGGNEPSSYVPPRRRATGPSERS